MARATSTSERVSRIIALLGQLTPGSRIAVADLAAGVGASEAELAADLETLAMCGVAPYDPGDLMPLLVEDGIVEVWGEMPAVRGPVRLSAGEARAMASALQASGIGADTNLTRRLLDAAAGGGFDADELERTVRSATSFHESGVYEALAQGLQEHTVVTIEHVRAGGEELTVRDTEPRALFSERGAWYLTAWCRKADDWRTFRVDRIRSASSTAETFDPAAHGVATQRSAFSTRDLPAALLRFDASEPYLKREWSGATVVEKNADGSVLVSVPYAGTDWIARRVVARLGAVEVLEPAEVREAVRELAGR